jgi:hypothetical protein
MSIDIAYKIGQAIGTAEAAMVMSWLAIIMSCIAIYTAIKTKD